jgi:tetratricopeptide (TPR) repeat protein
VAHKKKTGKIIEESLPLPLDEESYTVFADAINMLVGSRQKKRKQGKPGVWKVESVGDHEWMFIEPPDVYDAYDLFDAGCKFLEEGMVKKAEKLLTEAVTRVPTHIDALHHLAIILDGKGNHDEALKLWNRGVDIGKNALPKAFTSEDRLEWGWLENRPFLRCQHGLATALLHDGKTGEARILFEKLLAYNPHDNQGVREVLLGMYLEQEELQKALALCKQYPDDMLAGLWYGYPLVLFKLGRHAQASKKLQNVVRESPKIAEELLKKTHKPPKDEMPGYITVGGWSEAYEYWEAFGKFWDEEALEWLKKTRS